MTSGNALAARLAKSCFALGIPIHTDTPGRGADPRRRRRSPARRAAARPARCASPPAAASCSPAAASRTTRRAPPRPTRTCGAAASISRRCRPATPATASASPRTPARAWRSASPPPPPGCRSRKVPNGDGSFTAFPHLLDRYKPGVIAVTRNGRRFCNEFESYHDVGAAMIEACAGEPETAAWLICDRRHDRASTASATPSRRRCRSGRCSRNGYLQDGRDARRAGGRLRHRRRRRSRRPSPSTTAARSTAATSSSTAARPRSTATSPTPSTSRTPASRRSRRGRSTR